MRAFRNILRNHASVPVHAHWDAIVDATYDLHKSSPECVKLFDLSPSLTLKNYKGEAFNAFLPPSVVAVGDVWKLDLGEVIPFLYQFHRGATGELRHGQKGAFACLRALAADYADIAFRIHSEFILAIRPQQEGKTHEGNNMENEARFIPSQFVGQLLINLNTRTVCDFSIALPPRNSNVDINTFEHADMVFVPRMELLTPPTKDRSTIAWKYAITTEEVRRNLALKFYKFAEINWLSFTDAVAESSTTHRPIHAILAWGPLDDESC